MRFELLILGLAVYNIWYGALCWVIAGLDGLLFGSIIMVIGVIFGVLLRESPTFMKQNDKIHTGDKNKKE